MAPIIEVSDETLEGLDNFEIYYKLIETPIKPIEQVAGLDRRDWINIPYEHLRQINRQKGGSSMQFNPARLAYSPEVQKAGEKLGVNYQNTSKDLLRRSFVGNNNWFNSLKFNLALGNKTPNLAEFNNIGFVLFQGMQGKLKLYNVSGKEIDKQILQNYFNDIYAVKNPWRAEWIDADFKVEDRKLYLKDNHILDKDGNLISSRTRKLQKNILMQNKTPGISLTDFLTNPTQQGLPNKETKKGDLYYWHPLSDNNSVARFNAVSCGAYLSCDRSPSNWYANLGVRAVRHE